MSNFRNEEIGPRLFSESEKLLPEVFISDHSLTIVDETKPTLVQPSRYTTLKHAVAVLGTLVFIPAVMTAAGAIIFATLAAAPAIGILLIIPVTFIGVLIAFGAPLSLACYIDSKTTNAEKATECEEIEMEDMKAMEDIEDTVCHKKAIETKRLKTTL